MYDISYFLKKCDIITIYRKGEFIMICTFFGHRDAPSSIETALKETIEALLKEG